MAVYNPRWRPQFKIMEKNEYLAQPNFSLFEVEFQVEFGPNRIIVCFNNLRRLKQSKTGNYFEDVLVKSTKL